MKGRRLLLGWFGALALVATEVAVALRFPGWAAPAIVLGCCVAALLIVGLVFMHLPSGPPLAHAFVIAVLFWLAVLLGLGGMDPFTRIDYPVPVTRHP